MVELNVTEVPVQTGLANAAIVILTVCVGKTIIVIVLEVAGFVETQVRLEVKRQVMASLLNGMYV